MPKPIKYILIAAILGIVGYNSVYIEPLDQIKAAKEKTIFNAKEFANEFMSNKTDALSTINASDFLTDLPKDVKGYTEENGKKLGISTDYYFLIEGDATTLQIEEEYVLVSIQGNGGTKEIRIATDFIFGNAIREACAMADIGDFQNTMDYNNISVEVNNIVRETILPSFIEKIKKGDTFHFKGAVKVNAKNLDLASLRVIPIRLKFNN